MRKSLEIRRAFWPEVTDVPHFIVRLNYEGCSIEYDDIYFQALDEVVVRLEEMLESRKGAVALQGGFRFDAVVESTATGGIRFGFTAKSSDDFPGRLHLEGDFSIDGEHASAFLQSLIDLFRSGKELILHDAR